MIKITEENPTQETEEIQTPAAEDNGDDEGLPFPRARVVNIIRSEIGKTKQIRSEVKDAMNLWLGELLKKLAREMGDTQYASVGIADFQRATKPYDMIRDIVKDEERMIASAEKLKLDADHIIRDFERFFKTIKGNK